MTAPRASHPWLARYCVRALQLMPTMPPYRVIQCAVRAYPHCADLAPERAAEIFAKTRHAEGYRDRPASATTWSRPPAQAAAPHH